MAKNNEPYARIAELERQVREFSDAQAAALIAVRNAKANYFNSISPSDFLDAAEAALMQGHDRSD
jgi:hypothetical protein